MTTPHPSHVKRRATFRGWRAQRPFWGGLFLILSGLELFLSANLKLALEVHFGPTGFLSYVLPAMMLLCGALTWVSPGQRLFYGILGTLTALYSLIGLNLGGFFLGTVLGVVGGGLAVSWSPAEAPAGEPGDEEPADDDQLEAEGEYAAPAYQEAPLDDLLADEPTVQAPRFDPTRPLDRPVRDDEPGPGMLTDTLPMSQRSPLHQQHGAGSADDERPPSGGGDLPRRRGLGGLLLAALLVAAVIGATQKAGPVSAAPTPCGSPTVKASASQPATQPSASASPSPSPSPTQTAAEHTGLLDWLGGLFGGGSAKQADPTPSVAESPSASPTGAAPTTKAPTASPSCATASPSSTPNNKKAQIAAGQPHVAAQPSILIAEVMTMDGLTYDGVADLTKKDGTTVKVLAFSMKKSVSTPFELQTPGAPKLLLTKSRSLTVEGNVKFYTTRFHANVLGVLPLTFTPSFPPPPIPLPGFYTDCNIDLVYVQSDTLAAPGLSIAYAS